MGGIYDKPPADSGSGGGSAGGGGIYGSKKKSGGAAAGSDYVSTPGKNDKSLFDQARHTVGGPLMFALKALDAPRAAVDKLNTLGPTIGPAIGPKSLQQDARIHLGNLVPGLGQLAAVGRLRDPNPKGIPGFVRNTAVDIAQDPLTYLSFGTGSGAKSGLKAIGESLGKDVAENVASKGAKKVLTTEMRRQVVEHVAAREGGTAKAGEKLLKAVDKSGQGGVKLLGRTVIPGEKFAPLTGPLADAKGRAIDSILGRSAIPRAGIVSDLGKNVAEDFGAAASRARAEAARGSEAQVRGIVDAVKASGATRHELEHVVLPALDVGGSTAAVPERLRPLVEHLQGVRKDFTDRQLAEGILPATRETSEYVPLELTQRGQRALEHAPSIAEKFGTPPDELSSAFRQGGHLKPRTLLPDEPLQRVENIVGGSLRDAGKLRGDLVEKNPALLIGKRAAYAEKAIAHKHFLDQVASLADNEGKPLLIRAEEGAKRPLGYVEMGDDIAGKYYAPKAIADEIEKVRAVVTNDDALKQFQGIAGRANTWWKGMATAGSIVTGGRYFLRNAVGNLWNAFLAGATNPADYTRAAHIQETVARRGPEALNDADRAIFDLAQKHGVLESDFSMNELANPAKRGGRLGRAAKDDRLRRAAVAANPFNSENLAIRGGRHLNGIVEDHARLSLFIHELHHFGSADEAARSVKHWLLDYGDRTALDATAGKFAGFWTWRSRNLPIQIAALAEQPGKFAAAAHVHDEALRGAAPRAVPKWTLQEGLVPAGKGMMAGVDLPASAAANALDPSTDNAINQFGGIIPALGKAVIEQHTGKSLFTGFPVKGSFPRRLVEAGVPLAGQVERAPYTAAATHDEQAPARLVTALTGLTARKLTAADKGEATGKGKKKKSGKGIYG